MAVDVTPVFAAYFARNRGPVPGDPKARQTPDYGVTASLDGIARVGRVALRERRGTGRVPPQKRAVLGLIPTGASGVCCRS